MQNDLIRDGYDKIARAYLDNRDRLRSGKYIHDFLKLLPKNSTVLDLGCGAGVPVDDILIKAGHKVIGIDISKSQIELARKKCPKGQYIIQDITKLKVNEYEVDGIVSFYTIFHLPRVSHQGFFTKLASYLPKGGILLVTMGDREFEGEHMLHGTKMWSSQYGTKVNRSLIEKAGFKIILDELDNSGGERHQVILGEKK